MISGMFLLAPQKEYPIGKLFGSKILRLATAFFFWSTFYAVIEQFHMHHSIEGKELMFSILDGPFHLWFLFMMIGLYIATPILREIAKNEKICLYFIVISFCYVFLVNAIQKAGNPGKLIAHTIGRLDLQLVAGYSTYFLLGHWLSTHPLKESHRKIVYALALFSIAGTILYNGIYSVHQGAPGEWVFGNLLPNTLFSAVGLFLFCQSFFSKVNFTTTQRKWISLTAKLSFGIYLVHMFFLGHLRLIGLPDFFIHPLFSIPISSCLTFLMSFCLVYVLEKIPVLRKYVI